jgi:hypothetical protein
MPEDYSVAAVRHYRDAALLEEGNRLDNADHLFGFAAECAIKSALVALPGFAVSGRLHSAYHKHINQLWDSVPIQNLHRHHRTLIVVLKQQRPFSDWSADQRYGSDGAVSAQTLDNHRRATKRLLGSVGLLGTRAGS